MMTTDLPPLSVAALARRDRQLRDLRFLETFAATLAGCGSEAALAGSAVHRIAAHFGARAACLAAHDPVSDAVEILHHTGDRGAWQLSFLLTAVAEGRSVAAGCSVALPVLLNGHVWGVLALCRADDDPAGPFSPQERQTARAAADRIGQELERRRFGQLDDMLDGLWRKTKPIDVYSHALRELRRLVPYDHSASVITLQRGTAGMIVRVEKVVSRRGQKTSLLDSARRARSLRLTPRQMHYLEGLRAPVVIDRDEHGYHLAQPNPDAAGLWRVLSLDRQEGQVVCFPLVFGGQMLGLLRLAARRDGAFLPLERHRPAIERLARVLAVTLYRSELYHQSDRQLQAIKRIGRVITEPQPVEEIARQVLDLALEVLHVEVGAVCLLNDRGELELIAHRGCGLAEPPVLRRSEGIGGKVVETGIARAVPDVSQEPGYVIFNPRVRSELVAPISYHGEVMGFLDVESFEDGRFRPEDEEVISFLEALANQAAIAIKTSQLHFEAMRRLGPSMEIDPALSTAGLQDLLIEELRDKNEQLAAASRAKSEFLARMSHDLRGPLNVMVGLANLLTDPRVGPSMTAEKQRESLQIIRSSGEVLASLIGNILDLSALEAGKVELRPAPLDAAAAFSYLRTMAGRLAAEHRRELRIEIDLAPGIGVLLVDEEKFMRIMINLLSNAVKFTPSGGTISVFARGGSEGLHLVVQDSGVGIAAEDRERVFQPFLRLQGAAAGRHGAGLGLAVVRQLVELHGGRVWVEAAPEGGSAFHVVLPHALNTDEAAPALPSAGALAPAERPAFEPVRSKGTVLVVEDTEAHLNLMRLAVTSRGYSMHGVASGEEALEWLKHNRPDVVLLDMNLPGIDGFTVAARIRERIETHTIPLIAVTAEALASNEERARASGCDAYLTKPIDIGRLIATIDAVLDQTGALQG